jgi:hypothetical protein
MALFARTVSENEVYHFRLENDEAPRSVVASLKPALLVSISIPPIDANELAPYSSVRLHSLLARLLNAAREPNIHAKYILSQRLQLLLLPLQLSLQIVRNFSKLSVARLTAGLWC